MKPPSDPVILLSWVNTELRDKYPSLSDLCEEEGLDESALREKFASVGYTYDEKLNKFI